MKIASISADPAYKDEVLKCADKCAEHLKNAGADNVEVCKTPGNPIVFGEKLLSADLPTVLVYGHYDVQPPDPLDLWTKPPFEPYIEKTDLHPDGAIFGRGSADDKGQFFMHIRASQNVFNKQCIQTTEELAGFITFQVNSQRIMHTIFPRMLQDTFTQLKQASKKKGLRFKTTGLS